MSTRSTDRVVTAGALAGGFVGAIWLVEILDRLLPGTWERFGVGPHRLSGLDGVLWMPLLHGDWGHLVSNSLPALVLAFLVLVPGIKRGLVVTAIIWVLGGLLTWLIGSSGTVVVGASGVIFGWLAYLLTFGLFARRLRDVVVGIVVFLMYGAILWGVLPGTPGVSWQGHLSGAVAGVVAAWFAARRMPDDES